LLLLLLRLLYTLFFLVILLLLILLLLSRLVGCRLLSIVATGRCLRGWRFRLRDRKSVV
jgi:hypothetical protein